MRIAIHGFGRIGRTVLRQIVSAPDRHVDIEIAAINDIAAPEDLAYLLRYDSTFGPLPAEVTLQDGALCVAGRRIPLHRQADAAELALDGVDVLLDCTGKARSASEAARPLASGAARVLISGPCPGAEVTVVTGANDAALGAQRVVSNASCTTNALAPLMRALLDGPGLRSGHVTTVHCYTNSQPLVDGPRGSAARSRAAAVSMIPTTTSATELVAQVLPELAGRLTGAALRVPTPSVSCIDAVVTLDRPLEDPQAWLRALARRSPVLGLTEEPLVSSDLRARPESLVIALPETRQPAPDQLRLFGWYDNEWGFSARMLDVARRMARAGD